MASVRTETTSDSDSLRDVLSIVMRSSPLDFVRRINTAGDQALYLERLSAPLAPPDDLRFVHRVAGGRDIAVFAQRLAWDSVFFGYGVAKIDALIPLHDQSSGPGDYRGAVDALLDFAAARQMTYLFATVNARDIATLRALGEAGFAVIETRAYYHRDLESVRA